MKEIINFITVFFFDTKAVKAQQASRSALLSEVQQPHPVSLYISSFKLSAFGQRCQTLGHDAVFVPGSIVSRELIAPLCASALQYGLFCAPPRESPAVLPFFHSTAPS